MLRKVFPRFGSVAVAAALLLASPAHAQSDVAAVADTHRPADDTAQDALRKPAEMLAFSQVKPGDKVIDFIPGHGYFTRLFAVAVKPGGTVIADIPAAAAQHDAAGAAMLASMAAEPAYGDVRVIDHLNDPAAADADIFWTARNYHDLHNSMPPEGIAAFNATVFKTLKPGGVYVIVDHAAAPGSGVSATKTLHRIDPAAVKAEVTAAGFVFDGESDVLSNPADAHDKIVFDPSIRGHTDQFAYRFRKPR